MILGLVAVLSAAGLVGGWIGALFAAAFSLESLRAISTLIGIVVAVWYAPRGLIASDRLSSNSLVSAFIPIILVGAALVRFSNLGWSEFQGDEARAMLLTERVVTGEVGAILEHRKGPGEILTAAIGGSVIGFESESLLRLPFAIAGGAALCGVAAIITGYAGAWFGIRSVSL